MRLLLIGAPGSGKGTQGARIAERYGVEHIAAGDILRAEDLLVERLLERAVREGRADDTPAIIRRRLDVFHEATAPLLDFYGERGLLHTVDGAASPDDVTAAIVASLPPLARVRAPTV